MQQHTNIPKTYGEQKMPDICIQYDLIYMKI